MAELKVSPIASRLRASILQQAVEGRLVPRDPAEGTADELLEQIREQRAELVKQKKAKAPKGGESRIYQSADGSWYEQRGNGEPVCIDDEIPFDIPETWAWARVEAIARLYTGFAFRSTQYVNSGVQVIRISDLEESSISTKDAVYYVESEELEKYLVHRNSILICMTGSIGKMAVVTDDKKRYLNQRVGMLEPYFPALLPYLWYYLHTSTVIDDWVRAKTSTNGNIKNKDITDKLIPIPPLAEQERIVARIDELMPLVNQLEIRERESDAVDTAFWKALPQSILQEAVQGRLAPQDDADEPADALLEGIRKQRTELVKQKKAKAPKGGESRIYQSADGSWYEQRGKGEPKCIDEEIPFDIPESWAWARLSTFALVLNGDRGKNYPAKSKLHKEGIPFVSAINIDNHRVVEDQMLYMTDEQYDALGAGKLEKEDFVFCIRGSLGKYGVFPFEKGAIASSLVIVRAVDDSSVSRDYIGMLLGTPITGLEIRSYNNGTAQPNLSAANFERFLYPVPPLAEQERIVGRIDEIMSLLDKALN